MLMRPETRLSLRPRNRAKIVLLFPELKEGGMSVRRSLDGGALYPDLPQIPIFIPGDAWKDTSATAAFNSGLCFRVNTLGLLEKDLSLLVPHGDSLELDSPG